MLSVLPYTFINKLHAMKKKIFIIPGFRTQATDDEYAWLISYSKENGFDPIVVPVKWSRTTVTRNIEDFILFYERHKAQESYVLGFSYGAVIALLSANRIKANLFLLCSLSPAFKEDLLPIDISLQKYIGKNRYDDLSKYSAVKAATQLVSKTFIFFGEKEALVYPKLLKRCQQTAHLAKKASLIKVKDAGHQINHISYKTAIIKLLTL